MPVLSLPGPGRPVRPGEGSLSDPGAGLVHSGSQLRAVTLRTSEQDCPLDIEDCFEELLGQPSYIIKNQLIRGFGTQKDPTGLLLLALRWFFMA